MSHRVSELLGALDSRDLFENRVYLAEFGKLGPEAIPHILEEPGLKHAPTAISEVIKGLADSDREKACSHLVRALRRGQPAPVRLLALSVMGDELKELTNYIDRFVEIALDRGEPDDLRTRAFRVLKTRKLLLDHVRDIGKLLTLEDLGPGCPGPLRDAVFECLKAHADKLPVAPTMTLLDPFLTHPEPGIRVHALELLGEVGDIADVERMCMLPNTIEEIDRIQQAIGRILLRPANLIALRWGHFEHFIGHLLRKMEHYDVEVVGGVRDDGVDLTSCQQRKNAKGPGDERWAVQCKRWTSKNVDVDVLEALIEASRTTKFNAKHALLITTSNFTERAIKYAKEHSSAIELIAGKELLAILDKEFGAGRYTIRSRS